MKRENIPDLLLSLLLRLNDKGLIDNHSFVYEDEIRNFLKTKQAKKLIDEETDSDKKNCFLDYFYYLCKDNNRRAFRESKTLDTLIVKIHHARCFLR